VFPAGAASAQLPRPDAAWSTVETEHFRIHYPEELSAWALHAAGRLEAVHAAVTALVGHAPAEPIDVLVHDPFGGSNGLAGPGPLVVLWPNPPDPGSTIGEHRGWSEILAVHEIAHVAHLEWPTRNPRERWLWRLVPIPGHPIAVKTPRWAIEGYATWVEGRVTGSGRPHGAWRPAVLRQWAIEGRLPAYAELNGSERFLGGAMAYLAGSAYLEWLVDRTGEEGPVHLWRRLTARTRRGFDEAFAGVFGGPPSELYGRFTAELTSRAIEVEHRVEAAGRVEGEPFQRLAGATGEPAVSPDGRFVAVVVAPPREPSRLVVWSTAPEDTTAAEERAARVLARDTLDVPAVAWRPPPREPVATLWPAGGRSHRAPRFLPDGRIVALRFEGVGGGRARSDLFVWDWREGGVRRVTRGAGLRAVDPLPDGTGAVGTRCAEGRCDVVRIDLATGAVTTIVRGELDRSLGRPRVSSDGGTIVVPRQLDGRWRLEAMDLEGNRRRFVDPDDGASRFDPAFDPGGGSVLATSDAGGILDLERIDLATGAVERLTRTTGAAVAPEPTPGGEVYFLVLRSRGWQLHRLADGVAPTGEVETGPALVPAVRAPSPGGATLAPGPLPEPRPYGLGPRAVAPFPRAYAAEEGWSVGAVAVGSDPVGRLGWALQGTWGSGSAWRGGSGTAVWRAWGPAVTAEAFAFRHSPSEQDDPPGIGERLDVDLAGVSGGVAFERDRLSTRSSLRLGGSVARLDPDGGEAATRAVATASGAAARRFTPARWRLDASVGIEGATGKTDDATWGRVRADGRLEVGHGERALRLGATWGLADESAPVFERFAVGGVVPPAFDRALLSQRLPMPALPAAALVGRRALRLEVALETARGVSPFFRAARGGAGFDAWVRVAGLEASLDTRPVPYFRLPAVHAVVGIGRILDGPNEDDVRAWGAIRFHP